VADAAYPREITPDSLCPDVKDRVNASSRKRAAVSSKHLPLGKKPFKSQSVGNFDENRV